MPLDNYSLCFSGGGVRSAFFNLGTLLAFKKADEKPTYISSVSVGGYVAIAP